MVIEDTPLSARDMDKLCHHCRRQLVAWEEIEEQQGFCDDCFTALVYNANCEYCGELPTRKVCTDI